MSGVEYGYRVITPSGDGATDTAAMLAWSQASPRPKLWLSPSTGKKLVIESNFGVLTGDYWVEGNGVEVVHKNASAPLFNLVRTMASPQDTVVGVEDVDHDISGSSRNVLVTRAELSSIANVANYPVGSYVLLSSEDTVPQDSIGRMGQVLRVAKIDAASGYVYFATTAWRSDLYTTDIRLTLMPVGETYINNLRLSIEAASGETLDNRTNPVIWVANCLFPRISNIDIIESCSTGITLSRCVGGSVSNIRVRKIRFTTADEGIPTNNRLGYGVYWTACNGTAIRDSYFANCRHAMTDNWTNASAAGATPRHGPNINCLIANNVAEFTRGAGFDTHSSGINNLFVGNLAMGARSDSSGLGAGFQIRGEHNVMIGNTDYDCEVGIQVFENTADGTEDTFISGHRSVAKKIGLLLEGHASSTRKLNVNIDGGSFETKQAGSAAGVVVQATRAKVNFRNTTIKPRGQNGGDILDLRGDTIVTGTVVYDPQNAAGTWDLQTTSGSNNDNRVTVHRDADDAAPGDAAYVITDVSPDVITFSTTLTANRAVTVSCTGRKRVLIKRTAAGAFDLTVAHSGTSSPQVLAENEAVEVLIHGATVMLVTAVISLA